MKLKFTLPLLAFIAIVIVAACRKEFSGGQQKVLDPFVAEAKSAFYDALRKSGPKSEGAAAPDKLVPVWSRAYHSETSMYEFTEVPLLSTRKRVQMYGHSKQSNEADLKAIFRASFQRLLTFKQNGGFRQYILTYIPDIEYLKSNNMDASGNRITKLDKDYSGFIEYRRLNGEKLFLVRFDNGKFMFRKRLLTQLGVGHESNSGAKNKAMTENCAEICEPQYEWICVMVGDPEVEVCPEEPRVYGFACRLSCIEEPDPDPSQNCENPDSFYLPECGGLGGDPQDYPGDPNPDEPGDPDPCAQAQAQEANGSFQNKMTDLKGKTTGMNREAGYIKYASSSVPVYSEGPPNTHDFPAPQPSAVQDRSLQYIAHTHYHDTNNPSLSIFSADDVNAFFGYITQNKTEDFSKFTLSVTTSQGTSYSLVMSDYTKFSNYFVNSLTGPNAFSTFSAVYGIYVKTSNTPAQNEAGLAKMISDFDMGISVLKASSDFTDWKKMNYNSNNNTVSFDNCN